MNADATLESSRARMLTLLRARIHDRRVIEAMAFVRRERFVPPDLRSRAYDDAALPIDEGQTISQPLIVAMMLEALALSPSDRVLEVGTGSGYEAAVLSHLALEITTVERLSSLRHHALSVLVELGLANVRVYPAADELGLRDRAPYDAVVVSAGAPHVPRALIDQLAEGGRLVLPVGDLRAQELLRVVRTARGIELTRLGPCAFVPLVGPAAWSEAAVSDAVIRPNVR
jgi:protein-L-isoaspartate(D-aspartate) O-methyltransferase